MSSDASFEGYNSPSTRSVSVVSAPNYYYETTPPLEDVHRHQMAAVAAPRMPVQASAYSQPAFAAPYLGQASIPPYYPAGLPGAQAAQPQISGLYYQRPLPQVRLLWLGRDQNQHANLAADVSSTTSHSVSSSSSRCQPLATPSLHLAFFGGFFPAVTGSLHLPDVQQGLFQTELATNSQPLSHRREAFQVPSRRLR